METTTLLTGSFHAFLALSYILGGTLLLTKKQKFRFSSVDIIFIIFFCMVFLSYLLLGKTSTKIAYAPLKVIAPYFGIQLLASEERTKKFFNYCILATAILIIPSFYELLFDPIFAERGRFSMFMFPERGGNEILMGITFAVLLIILIIKILEGKEKLKAKHLIILMPSAFLLIRAGSRGALLSFLITILFYFSSISKFGLKKKTYVMSISILLLIGSYKFVPESTKDFYETTLESQYNPASSVYQRKVLIQEAFDDFNRSPFWGIGTGNSVRGYGAPHNILLEVLVEWGIIGLSMFLLMCYLTIRTALRFIRTDEQQDLNLLMKISFVLFLYFLVRSMVGGYITTSTGFFISIGLISSLKKIQKNNFISRQRDIESYSKKNDLKFQR